MSRYLGIITTAISFAFAMACGGGGGSGTNVTSVTGALDSSVLTSSMISSGEYEVWAKQGDTYIKKGVISQASAAGEDPTYRVDSLEKGQTYTIELARVSGFTKAPVLSSILPQISESDASLTKAYAMQKVKYKRQMNMVSTYIARKMAASNASASSITAASVSSMVSQTFGSSVTSLSDIVMDNGKITTVAGSGIVFASPLARAVMTQMTVATSAMVCMSSTSLSVATQTLSTFMETIVSATSITQITTTTLVSQMTSLVSTAVSTSSAASFSSTMASADTITYAALGGASSFGSASITTSLTTTMTSTSTFASSVLAVEIMSAIATNTTVSSAYVSTMATDAGVSVATLQAAASTTVASSGAAAGLSTTQISQAVNAASGSVNIAEFDVAHATYGSRYAFNFTLSTLSPVFRIKLDTALPTGSAFSDYVDITIKGTSTTITNANLSGDTLLKVVSADNQTFLLMVKKTASTTITTSSELRPGGTYTYTITTKNGKNVQMEGREVTKVEGTISVKAVTFTYPITSTTTDSLVNLGVSTYTGLSSLTPTFLVNASDNVDQYVRTSSAYGVLDDLTIQVKKSGTVIAALNTGTQMTVSSASESAALVAPKTTAGIASGTSYTLSVTNKTMTIKGTALTAASLPGEQTMTTKSTAQ